MRRLIAAVVLVLNFAVLAYGQQRIVPVVCVSAVPDLTGKSIGPLGNLNDELALEITQHRKPLQGLAVSSDVTGSTRPSAECDYLLTITLHVGGSTAIALNPLKPNPLDPTNDPRRSASEWLVRASYRLTATPRASTSIKLDDSITARYEPNVEGYGTDLPTVARRLAHNAAHNAAGTLKKKLKL